MIDTVRYPGQTLVQKVGDCDDLTVLYASLLENAGIQVVQAERGGNITYHGPGQLVAYLVLDLEAAKMGVKDFVHFLEEAMIRTAAEWGVAAERNPVNRGIWVGNSKMGSIGIAIRRGITYHGLAFNVDVSLEPFGWINPCGLAGVGILAHRLAHLFLGQAELVHEA